VSGEEMSHALVRAGLMLALGAAGQGVLRRAGRRVPLVLTRRLVAAHATHPDPALGRIVGLVLLPATLVLWGAVGWAVSERVALVRGLRDTAVWALVTGLQRPLFVMHERGYSLLDLSVLPACLAVVWIVVGAATRVVQSRLRGRAEGAHGGQETLGTLVRYAGTAVGALIVLQAWGIDVRTLALAGSVVGVGLGFGLQHLANNFVSGVVLGLERPIKPGDYVRVGEFQGTVERIGARSTEIVTGDRVSILVPNSRLLETEVINWTHGDPSCRVTVPVGVAYDSDLRTVRAALLDAAAGHPDVLCEPPPRVELRGFGESSLELELEVFTREPHRQHDLVSDLNFRIAAALRAHGVAIPFPQRDLRLPELAALVSAFARRHFTAEELAAAPALERRAAPAADRLDLHDRRRTWDDAALDVLAARLRGAGGVPVADRRHLLSVHPRCFVGREAVDWLCANESLSRPEAVGLGQRLLERGAFRHVLDEHPFRDGNFYYRFSVDPTSPPV
jgi:potassium-dependent mechanosensitive channel